MMAYQAHSPKSDKTLATAFLPLYDAAQAYDTTSFWEEEDADDAHLGQ
jgi:hypothetical protein